VNCYAYCRYVKSAIISYVTIDILEKNKTYMYKLRVQILLSLFKF